MKILYIITKGVVGGAQTSVLNLAREMKARGHEVAVGFGEGEWLGEELAKENISFYRFNYLKRTHDIFSPIFFIKEIIKFLKEKKFDVVHFNSSNSLPGALGVKLVSRKIKTVFTFRGMSMLDEHYQMSDFFRFLYKIFFQFFLLFVDEPVFVSDKNFEKFGQGQLINRGNVIYNGLNPLKNNFFPREKSLEFFKEKTYFDFDGKYIIGCLGRLDYAKNYEFLINVFPEILKIKENAVAVIIGEGEERKKCEQLIKKNNLQEKIFLLGNIDNGARYLNGFDILALPSRYEGLPIALIESLFADLPVLASNVGGNSEVVSSVEDEIYELDSKEEFLKKINALQSVDVVEKIKNENKILAEKFTLKNTANGYEKIYSN